MNRAVRQAIEQALGETLTELRPLAGGDINDAFAVTCNSGRMLFVKTHRHADHRMFPAEARGLNWLREAGAIRVPEVVAVSPEEPDTPAFLVLEYLVPAPPAAGFDERLGRGLARLHQFGAPTFGLDEDNFIGRLPQCNTPARSWVDFYRDRRLAVELDRAIESGVATRAIRRGCAALFDRLEALLGPEEPVARLHGDLWGGNLHRDQRGEPVLIDPAVYGGHREVDLAMMKLFGGFGERVFAAYREAFPLAPGFADRVELYQLYPLLVHVNHFGGSYVASVERVLARYI